MEQGTLVILDGATGEVTLGPTLAELERAKQRQAQWQAERKVQLSAAHTPEHLARAVEAFTKIGRRRGVLRSA